METTVKLKFCLVFQSNQDPVYLEKLVLSSRIFWPSHKDAGSNSACDAVV